MFLGQDPLNLAFWAVLVAIAFVVFVREYKRERQRRYSPANKRQKAVCVVLLATMLIVWAVYLAGWPLFGGYEKQVALAVQLIGMLYLIRLTAILEVS